MNSTHFPIVLAALCGLSACNSGSDDGPNQPPPSTSRSSLCTIAEYPEQSISTHILPYSIGETYELGQGNCVAEGAGSHAKDTRAEFAYDFLMPIGTSLLATQAGTVIYVEEGFVDGTRVPGEENTIVIRHDDGTLGNYGHLTTLGAFVEVGSIVDQGKVIGMSGDSGASSQPHLHFEILECQGDPIEFSPVVSFNNTCRSLGTTFRNTRPHSAGLVEGESYTAEEY